MEQELAMINDSTDTLASAHVVCGRFTNNPYWIFLSFKVIEFPSFKVIEFLEISPLWVIVALFEHIFFF